MSSLPVPVSLDADGRAGVEHLLELTQHVLHRLRLADDAVEPALLLAPLEVAVLAAEPLLGDAQARDQAGVVEREGGLGAEQERDLQVRLGEHAGGVAVVGLDEPGDLVAAPQRDGDDRQDLAAQDRLGGGQLLGRVGGEDRGAVVQHAAQHRPAGADRIHPRARAVAAGRRAALGPAIPLPRQRHGEAVLVAVGAEQHRHVGGARQELERGVDHRLERVGQLDAGRQRRERLVDAERAGRVVLDPIGDLGQIDDRSRCDQPIAEVGRALRHPLGQPDPQQHRIGGVAQLQAVARLEADLPVHRRVDVEELVAAPDRGTVRRPQIAVDELVSFEEDLPMLSGQVVVAKHQRVGVGAAEGDGAVFELEDVAASISLKNFEDNHGGRGGGEGPRRGSITETCLVARIAPVIVAVSRVVSR